jgi:hypothetical protein
VNVKVSTWSNVIQLFTTVIYECSYRQYLSLASLSSPACLHVRLHPILVKLISGDPLYCRLLDLPTSIGLSWKVHSGTNICKFRPQKVLYHWSLVKSVLDVAVVEVLPVLELPPDVEQLLPVLDELLLEGLAQL